MMKENKVAKMNALVGYTGFVGSNLANEFKFDKVYNSKNIIEAYDTQPDLLVYAGVPATKFLANKNEILDFAVIKNAISNIKQINPQKLVLISTVDVFDKPIGIDESFKINPDRLKPYGKNRFYLEIWVKNNIKNYLIVRLPALYGKNIKKNFIFDMINIIPTMLSNIKYNELSVQSKIIKDNYQKESNGFYRCKVGCDKHILKEEFLHIGFNALNFTDSRAVYQFYYLKYLWRDINIAMRNKLNLLHLAVEPLSVRKLYRSIYHEDFVNELTGNIPFYDYRTKYGRLFESNTEYIYSRENALKDINNFVRTYRNEISNF